MSKLSTEEAIKILEDMKIDIPVPKAAVTQIKRNIALDMAVNVLSNSSEFPNSWIPRSKRLPDKTGMYEVTYKYVIKHFDSAGKHFKDEIIYLTDYDNWKQFSRKWKRHGDTVIAWRNTSNPYQPEEE